MRSHRLILVASGAVTGLLPCLVPAVAGGVLWLQLGSSAQPALDADGSALTLAQMQAWGVHAYATGGEDLGEVRLDGLDAAGEGFLAGVVAIAASHGTNVALWLGPDSAGRTACLGEGFTEADAFVPYVDPDLYGIACLALTWKAQCTLTYLAGANGSIVGVSPQTVTCGGSGTAVTAVPAAGYQFVQWSDGVTTNPRLDTDVTADLTISAEFAAASFAVTFVAGQHGSLSGVLHQTVLYGEETSPVTAVPDVGYAFLTWSDGSAANPRVLVVSAEVALTAVFDVAAVAAPAGAFLALTDAEAGPERRLWDLTGDYSATAAGYPLTLALVHDAKGKLTGVATCTVANGTVVTTPIRGTAKGTAGDLVVKLTIRGANPDKTASVALAMDLALDAAACQLEGALRGTVTTAGTKAPVGEAVVLAVPSPMDGTWSLLLDLVEGTKAVTGTALLTLANGAEYLCTAKGKVVGTTVALVLSADSADAAASGLRMRATVTPLTGGWAVLEAFSARGFGQRIAW